MHTPPNLQLAGMIGGQEILVILLIILIFFGGRKIPELMKGLGKGMREYKKAVSGVEDELSDEKPQPKETVSTEAATNPDESKKS